MKNLTTIFKLLFFPFSFLINNLKEISILNLNIRKMLLVFISVFISTSAYAVELVNEQFTSNIDGWSVSGNVRYSTAENGSMRIDGNGNNNGNFNNRGWRTYSFPSYAGKTVDIEVYWCATSDWESDNDYLRTRVNGSTVDTDKDGGGCQSRTFTADVATDGVFKIEFSTYVSQTNEDAWIDWVTVNYYDDNVFQEGLHDFELINPLSTRNIIGNYVIAGNTIECITNERSAYDGACQDSNAYNDNNYMAKYLNIDGDSGIGAATWNASSSNFTLPDTQNGILWAGLFWQGSINNEDSDNSTQRRAYVDGSGYSYKYISGDEPIDLRSTDGNKLLLRIDNDASYTEQQATTFYYDRAHGSDGGYYAAYTDITQFLRDKDLADGNHTATVANITANEGRQTGTGNYAGWTMVVIYAESGGGSKARNISVYNGYTVISSGSGTRSVKIEGFRLPSSNTVTSQFSAFAGEGEHLYTPDSMFISKFSDLASPQGMPVAAGFSSTNIFDAILANIDRDSENDNDVVNANGIDIESYDVSDIMTTYRDADENIDTVYIGMNSGQDYITPSMMAFATELYRPSVCYDYTVQKDGFDITQDSDRNISTNGTGELSITLAIQSLEGDFNFENSQMGIRLVPTSNTRFTEALFAPNNVNTLIPAIETTGSTPIAPIIAIGEDPDETGGTIKSNQRYFSAFNYDLLGDYEGKFEVDLNTTIDFGSGAVPTWQSTEFNDVPRCPQSDYYNPIKGAYNIERTDSENYDSVTEANQRYPLYTQVVGKDFDVDLVAYEEDPAPSFTKEIALTDYTVDIELINSSPFSDDQSVFVCNNPSPSIIQTLNVNTGAKNVFAKFPASPSTASSRVDLSGLDIITNTALRNAAFRIWYIVDKNNTILPHQCDQSDNTCFETLYTTHLKQDDVLDELPTPGVCSSYVSRIDTTKRGCYAYLRDFFSAAVCSRDNFAIRPASYRVKISDNNESLDPLDTVTELGENTSAGTISVATLSAGYKYKLNGIATSYLSDTTIARGYNKSFASPFGDDVKSVLLFDTDLSKNSTTCFDKNNTDWGSSFDDGQIYSTYLDLVVPNNHVKHSNVGEYHYHIKDANWTLVDQDRYDFKTWDGVDDCIYPDSDSSITTSTTGMSGCTIDTEERTINGFDYRDLYLTFVPYKFNLGNVGDVNHPDNAVNYTYFNDFDNSYYDDLTVHPIDMSMSFEGNISALGADDITLTNFTDTCKATPLVLTLLRRKVALPDEDALYDSKTNLVQLQQYLQHTSNLSPFVDKEIGVDRNITLPKDGFSDAVAQGQAEIFLHTTFKKPKNAVIDPFDITYETLEANGTALLQSSAHMGIHIPDGFQTYDRNITYYFTKVTPQEKIYEDVIVNFKVTAIYVDIYCSLGADCNTSFNLDTLTKGLDETSDWYYASIFDSITDGTTDLIPSTVAGVNASPSVSPNDDVVFDVPLDGTHNDIVVSVSGPGRPSTVEIEIRPVPWLLYDETNVDGYPHYQVDFIDNSGWSGVGNTGRVTGSKSSTESSPKMNW